MRTKKELNIQIGEQIRNAREKAKLTQEQLSERIEVSPQYISDLERGVVGISLATLRKVCVVLCVSSDQILFSSNNNDFYSILSDKCKTLSPKQLSILSEIIDKYIQAIHSD